MITVDYRAENSVSHKNLPSHIVSHIDRYLIYNSDFVVAGGVFGVGRSLRVETGFVSNTERFSERIASHQLFLVFCIAHIDRVSPPKLAAPRSHSNRRICNLENVVFPQLSIPKPRTGENGARNCPFPLFAILVVGRSSKAIQLIANQKPGRRQARHS